MSPERSVWIGFDPREADAYAVSRSSAQRHLPENATLNGLVLSTLVSWGMYDRPTVRLNGQLWDQISDAPMSTEFACSRFLVTHLAHSGWALFMDGDVLVRRDLSKLFELADPTKAVMVVKHDHRPQNAFKMEGQAQTAYPRKNWSSVMLFNCDHPANHDLTVELVNTVPGRDLHRFCWLPDHFIGELPMEWNWLAGHSDGSVDPAIVHFTDGVPSMRDCEDAAYAAEWRAELVRWAS